MRRKVRGRKPKNPCTYCGRASTKSFLVRGKGYATSTRSCDTCAETLNKDKHFTQI